MKPSRRAVYCAKCGKFLFNLEITAEELLPVGAIAEVRDVRCRCNFKNNIWIGLADKDVRSDAERIEEKLREKLEEKK